MADGSNFLADGFLQMNKRNLKKSSSPEFEERKPGIISENAATIQVNWMILVILYVYSYLYNLLSGWTILNFMCSFEWTSPLNHEQAEKIEQIRFAATGKVDFDLQAHWCWCYLAGKVLSRLIDSHNDSSCRLFV